MELQTMPLRFRVWDKENKDWAKKEDDYALRLDGGLSYHDGVISYGWRDRFAISQDTGCKDSEDDTLYTGDIVEENMFYKGQQIRGVVKYNGYANVVQYSNGLEESLFASSHYRKIGNIWQHPELLEK